jgi:hypothetical protein
MPDTDTLVTVHPKGNVSVIVPETFCGSGTTIANDADPDVDGGLDELVGVGVGELVMTNLEALLFGGVGVALGALLGGAPTDGVALLAVGVRTSVVLGGAELLGLAAGGATTGLESTVTWRDGVTGTTVGVGRDGVELGGVELGGAMPGLALICAPDGLIGTPSARLTGNVALVEWW